MGNKCGNMFHLSDILMKQNLWLKAFTVSFVAQMAIAIFAKSFGYHNVALTAFIVLLSMILFACAKALISDRNEKQAFHNLVAEARYVMGPELLGTKWTRKSESEKAEIHFSNNGLAHIKFIDLVVKNAKTGMIESKWSLDGQCLYMVDKTGKPLKFMNKHEKCVIAKIEDGKLIINDYLNSFFVLNRT
jgi:hypothetical protein